MIVAANNVVLCSEISDSYGDEYKDGRLILCDAV